MKIGVVGYGVVGKHMAADIKAAGHECLIYDTLPKYRSISAFREQINTCDAAFVCVSTPEGPDGAADISAIRDVAGWLDTPVIIIRSTVPPGTTNFVQNANPFHAVAFVPEFIGEGVNAPYNALRQPPFLVVGADPLVRDRVLAVLSVLYNAECEFVSTDAITAECIKYAENIYLATKVTLFNEFYDWVTGLGGDWGQFVNGLTHDYRIGRSHTHVYPDNRGWGGRCLPKDTAALLALVGPETAPLLAAVRVINDQHRAKNIAERAGMAGAGSPSAGGNGHG